MSLETTSSFNLARGWGGLPRYPIVLCLGVVVGCLVILVLSLLLDGNGRAAQFWLGAGGAVFPFPFTIQNIEHLLFFLAMADIFVRRSVARRELSFLEKGYLPEDAESVLTFDDLGPLRRKVAGDFDGDNGFLPYLIDLSVLQVQASRSVDQTVSVLNSTLELIAHKVDLRYQLLRYLAWAIPTIGFIGTVVGIASALSLIDPDHMDLKRITASLAVAFDTTVIALIESAIIVLLLNLTQKQEELAVNRAGEYCLKNLINRLYLSS
ncbi:MAG: MotA/TolQ/ExbB proton channel family protein [Hyphomicrobiaceae bacterium]|nr:MotA/TolQ/ExbB proton channel family protein [Hyphomicrobiaceae bacterium]